MTITNGYCTLPEFKLYAKITSTDRARISAYTSGTITVTGNASD